MWAAAAATTAYCAKKVREEADPAKVPLMGVTGAFVFAAQMVNFTIPGTGSSGHLGGGLILAVLLGPWQAFLVMASVLTVQALFFADGGLLALGCNIFNLGFFPAFVAYPLVYRRIVGDDPARGRLMAGAVLAAMVGLGLGAFGVVLQTTLSGISALPFVTFASVMMPIHLVIGLVEGLVTAAVVTFVSATQPEILRRTATGRSLRGIRLRPVIVGLTIAALLSGGVLSWFASTNPDGLEWSIARVAGRQDLESRPDAVKDDAASLQDRTAVLPGYGFSEDPVDRGVDETAGEVGVTAAGTSVSGLVGVGLTLALVVIAGGLLGRRASRPD